MHSVAHMGAQAINVLFFHYGTSSTCYSDSVDGKNACMNHRESEGDN